MIAIVVILWSVLPTAKNSNVICARTNAYAYDIVLMVIFEHKSFVEKNERARARARTHTHTHTHRNVDWKPTSCK